MNLPNYSKAYEQWAPVVGRVLFGGLFLLGASLKIPGTASFAGEVAMTASAGVPFATIAVLLALVIELVGGIALIIGWNARIAAFVLAPFTLILTLIFHSNLADPNQAGMFTLHLTLIAGLLYTSVYGAQHAAVSKDALPQS
jgi:putative oxidoreductase